MTGPIQHALTATALLVSTAAFADAVDDSCHDMAKSGEAPPEMFAGPSAVCKNKSDLALVCSGLVKKIRVESQENYVIRHFIVPNAACKDKDSVQAFCKVVQSYDGYQIFKNDGTLKADPSDPEYAWLTNPHERAAKVCGTTSEAIHAHLCSKADQPSQWNFAFAECPALGKQIYQRECSKVVDTCGEGGKLDSPACRKFDWCNEIKVRLHL